MHNLGDEQGETAQEVGLRDRITVQKMWLTANCGAVSDPSNVESIAALLLLGLSCVYAMRIYYLCTVYVYILFTHTHTECRTIYSICVGASEFASVPTS